MARSGIWLEKPQFWQFRFTLESHYWLKVPSEPTVVSKLLLPNGYHIEVRRVQLDQTVPISWAANFPSKIGYELMLDESAKLPVKITVKIDPNYDRPDTAKCPSNEDQIEMVAGEPIMLICIKATEEIHLGEFKVILNVQINDDVKPPEKPTEAENHLGQISSLLESRRFADCKVVSQDGEEFACHKAILSLKSAVILTAFEVEHMSEAKTGRIQLDCDSDVVKLLLRHFYTGEIPVVPDEILMELYGVAHLYQIESLKTQLAEEMLLRANDKLLTIPNVLEFVIFADKYDLDALKLICLKFIFARRSKVVKLPEWKDFQSAYPILIEEILLS